jgi:hypothetical protein
MSHAHRRVSTSARAEAGSELVPLATIKKLTSSESSELATDEATLRANLSSLRLVVGGEPTARQIEAVSAVENFILTAGNQQAAWAKLRLIALRELGELLLRTPRLRGRRRKESTVDSLPSLADLGITDRHIAARAVAVASIGGELFNEYLAIEDEPTEKGLLRFGDPIRLGRGLEGGFLHPRYVALMATKGNVEYYTPAEIFDAMNTDFDLDPASPGRDVVPWIPAKRHYTLADNGLERPWRGYVWLNPPYSREGLPLWLDKFRQHGNGVCCVVDRTSTAWWQSLCGNADLILQVNKKIDFISDESSRNALGSSLVAYGERGVKALMNAHRLGALFKPVKLSP